MKKNNMGRSITQMSIVLILVIPLLSMVGVAQTGALDISSRPGEADVYIDGIYKGSTPIYKEYDIHHLSVRDIPIGIHTLKIAKTGYFDWNNTIQISSGTETINVYLDIMKGELEIYIEAGIGEVYIDGIFKGLAGTDAPFYIYIPYGSYEINISREGCNYWKQTIQVQKQLTKVVSPFNCTLGNAPQQKSAEISFAFGQPSISYAVGSMFEVDVIVRNTGISFKNMFPIVLSLRDPYGNLTILPYQYVTLDSDGITHVYFDYQIPSESPLGTWTVKAEIWDRVDKNNTLQTRYNYEEKTFNLSLSSQNISISSVPAEPVTVSALTGKTIVTKLINSKFGQSNLQINAGGGVMWENGDIIEYVIIEMNKKIANINISNKGKAKYIFNTSGNYRFSLHRKYDMLRISQITQNILVIPPISTPSASPTVISPSITPTVTIAQITTNTPTFIPTPTPKLPGFEAILAGIGIFIALILRKR